MKKFGKISLVIFLIILTVLVLPVSVASYVIFTPDRLTPIVRKQAGKFIACPSKIGSVELTFFSTFPNFALKINDFALINPLKGSPSDTLIKVNELVGVLDAATWWKSGEIIVNALTFNKGTITVFSDSLGHTNYNITLKDTVPSPSKTSEPAIPKIDIRNVALNGVDINYNDLSLKFSMVIRDLSARLDGTFALDSLAGNVNVSKASVSVAYEGEKYLQGAAVRINIPFDVIPSRLFIRFKNGSASVNDLEFKANGSVNLVPVSHDMMTDISYDFISWPVKKVLTLVPPNYQSYLKGVEIEGVLASQGTVKGIYNDSVMPLMNLHLLLEKGMMTYPSLPQPLHDLEGDVNIYTDLHNDDISYLRINRFEAKTPKSAIHTEGSVNHLFKDIACDFSTTAELALDEFSPMIPVKMKSEVKGNVSGKVRSAFTMSQVQKLQIEKMKLSGSVTLNSFSVRYDSISMSTNHSKIDFALPNPNPSAAASRFASVKVLTDNMIAAKVKSYHALVQNAVLSVETSDARNTNRIPDLKCVFKMDSLAAGMDTMRIAIRNPQGNVILKPRPDHPDQPSIRMSYNSDQLRTVMGKNSMSVKKIILDSDIQNDKSQKDLFLQWLVKGFVDLTQGSIAISGLSNPIEIPSVKMNFDPETFKIKEGNLKIDKSDFHLIGNLNNILSYFRGDSILRGSFNFTSNNTDVFQLMALTSGIGNVDSIAVEQAGVSTTNKNQGTGPYMVPKGIDVTFNADIKTVTFDRDSATNVNGKVVVHDGNLLLDGLTFKTPAARMQLTAMYNTPRKNHLFVGMDYHMLDVEIENLLKMIPDIDSIMPMLRSFKGKGEFHIAVETYLDSMYNVKKSTLRGASSIKGNNLVLMDGETFTEIAKRLMFSKKTQNKVDSLSAEFTIFRNEVDVYPFLIVMDKYKAVIEGRHNFDLSFNYHIDVVDSPLPIKLGLDIKGNMDKYTYNLAKLRHPDFYRPTYRKELENKQLELMKMIRDMLTRKVKGK